MKIKPFTKVKTFIATRLYYNAITVKIFPHDNAAAKRSLEKDFRSL